MGPRTRLLFFQLFGVTALVAVASFWAQLGGLIGSQGIWPAALTMKWAAARQVSVWQMPTLAWLSVSDAMLHLLCALGCAAATALILGWAPRLALGVLWLSFLSLQQIGGPFLQFQWDILLIETAFFAIFYAPPGLRPRWLERSPSSWSRYLLVWIAFKVTFGSGVVKLMSGDPAWTNLTALSYHFWTQPLPTWTSYFMHQWGATAHKLMCGLMFLFELPLAVCALLTRPFRLASAVAMAMLQVGLALAGNYSYFNLLSLVLVVPMLDDALLAKLSVRHWPAITAAGATAERHHLNAGTFFAGFVVLLGVVIFIDGRMRQPMPAPVDIVLRHLRPFVTVNAYGAFAWMSKDRPEIIIEGSRDGTQWEPYEFLWKPGRLDARPKWVAPWQPRLDWQMWFAAMGQCAENPWLLRLEYHLLKGTPRVLQLLGDNPFGDGPPEMIRAQRYQYRFAPPTARGQWWERDFVGPYCPPLGMADFQRLIVDG